MSRFLITGSAGFIGARLTRYLLDEHPDQVTALVRPGGSPSPAPAQYTVFADLTDRNQTEAAFRRARPDIVFHCAMAGGHPTGAAGRLDMLAASVTATAHVAEAALAWGVRRFVHLGSFLVYPQLDRPVRESDPIQPYSFRGAAKAGACLWLQQCAALCSLPLTELRVFSVYGPGEARSRFIPTLLRAARDGVTLPLNPAPRHDFIFIDDVVSACLRAAEAQHLPHGVVCNIGSGQAWRNDEVVELARQATGRHIASNAGAYPDSPGDAGFWQADVSQAAALLGWRPRYSLIEGLEATYRCLPQLTSA